MSVCLLIIMEFVGDLRKAAQKVGVFYTIVGASYSHLFLVRCKLSSAMHPKAQASNC